MPVFSNVLPTELDQTADLCSNSCTCISLDVILKSLNGASEYCFGDYAHKYIYIYILHAHINTSFFSWPHVHENSC